MIDGVICFVMKGFGDMDDDVCLVSVVILIFMVKEFVVMCLQVLDSFIDIVWESFFNLGDDFSVFIGKIMDLFVIFCSFLEVLEVMKFLVLQDEERFFIIFVFRFYFFFCYIIIFVCFVVFKVLMIFVDLGKEIF